LAKHQFHRALTTDPLIVNQWHLKKIATSTAGTDLNVEDAWKYTSPTNGVRGSGIRIGIVDDGVETTHPDLRVDTVNGWDWNGNDNNPNPGTGDDHGTQCAGVAAAIGNNDAGVSGTAPEATVVGMRLISGDPTDADEAGAMSWKNDLIQVKSNSWGPSDDGVRLEGPGPLAAAAFADAVANGRGGKGTIFVWAGGNGKEDGDNSNYDGYANSIQTIAVGAIDSKGRSSYYSESGANLLVCAPSSGADTALDITTVDRSGNLGANTAAGTAGNYSSTFGGTSAAAPAVSGVVALMLTKKPTLGWRDVQEILFRSATKFLPADPGWKTNGAGFSFNPKFGGGLVNAAAAVDLAANWTNLSPQTSLAVTQAGPSTIPENDAAGVTRNFQFTATNHRVEHVTVKLSATHTARGNLAITLTSPGGMVSPLAEVHGDTGDDFSNWTFSSVEHWGESAAGIWKVNVADLSGNGNTTGGTLGDVTVTLFGSSTVPVNPPPQVQITAPGSGQSLSPATPIAVQAVASDVAIDGSPGVISSVQLLVDNVVAATDTTAPYEFLISPAIGSHSLVARATDSAGLTGTSTAVSVTVADQPPVISSVTLSVTGQAFADQPLTVASVVASDPEGSPVTLSYQWQSSPDAVNFTNAAGQTTGTLPAAAANAGKLWRCIVTASDGSHTSIFASAAVDLLARPLTAARRGTAYSYASGLVLAGKPETVSRRAILHEFSQGNVNGGSAEWVEILTLQAGNLAGLQLRESGGKSITFNTNAIWSNVPAGTLIVIYNASSRDALLPADDVNPADGVMVLPHTHAALTSTGWISLDNTAGDVITLLDGTATIHTVSYGASTGGVHLGAVGNLAAANFNGGSDAAADLAAGWTITAATAGVTPGAANNNAANQTFITKLRTNTLAEVPPFRLGAGSDVPAGLTLNPTTGVLSGTLSASATLGDHLIVIERYNLLGEVVSQTFTLKIGAAGYADWIAAFAVSDPAMTADPDGDGLKNLIEYLLDSDPKTANSPIAFTTDATSISLTYRQSKLPTDATLVSEWSTTLESASWQTAGIVTTVIEENDGSKLLKASLVVDPAQSKKFLRLKATSAP
jgi:subtilisin-like proprotein convertase family protein